MEKQEIARLALTCAMQHRMEKVLLPRQIGLENATEMIYNLFRTGVLSMFAFIAYTHRPKDLLTLKLSGQDEAFKQVASVLCFLADFLRESPDLLGLMNDLELDLGSRYMRSLRDFVDIKRAIRQIDLDFRPGLIRMQRSALQKDPISMGALCSVLGMRFNKKIKESRERHIEKGLRLLGFVSITAMCLNLWGNAFLTSKNEGRFPTDEAHKGFYHMLNGLALVFHLNPDMEFRVCAKIDRRRATFDALFDEQIRSNTREFAALFH